MATYYELAQDYVSYKIDQAHMPDDVGVDPHWIVAVVRLASPVTFSRSKLASFSKDSSDAAGTRAPTLIISNDCHQLTIHANKGEHLHGLQAMLYGGAGDYVEEVFPGDWVLAWIVNDRAKYLDLLQRIKDGKACNKFDDGLKFVGRASAPRKVQSRDPRTGMLTARWSLQASGFAELDSSIYYDPNLAETQTGMSSWLAKLGKTINDLIENPGGDENSPGAVSINQVIPYLSELLLGSGVTKRFSNPSDQPQLQIATGAGSGEAPFAYLVPKEVGDLLGKSSRDASKAGGILAYADLMELLYGLQRFKSSGGTASNSYKVLTPDGVSSGKQQKYTGKPMMGLFTPDIPTFSGRSVWSIWQQYLNPTVNEMYTAIRPNERGEVVPTVVVRQIPLSSDLMASKTEVQGSSLNDGEYGPADGPPQKLPEVTPFLELPRWRIPDVLVHEFDHGRSDAMRFNFVQILGQAVMAQAADGMTSQIVRNPPIRDDLDIQRSGLRPYQAAVACSIKDAVEGPRAWTAVASDWIMGQHMTFTGTMSMVGVQSPICPGDNVEWDAKVLHVETVVHQCVQSPNGRRSFNTILNLTHGVAADPDSNRQVLPAAQEDLGIYAGVVRGQAAQHDPAITLDSEDA